MLYTLLKQLGTEHVVFISVEGFLVHILADRYQGNAGIFSVRNTRNKEVETTPHEMS